MIQVHRIDCPPEGGPVNDMMMDQHKQGSIKPRGGHLPPWECLPSNNHLGTWPKPPWIVVAPVLEFIIWGIWYSIIITSKLGPDPTSSVSEYWHPGPLYSHRLDEKSLSSQLKAAITHTPALGYPKTSIPIICWLENWRENNIHTLVHLQASEVLYALKEIPKLWKFAMMSQEYT